MADENDVSFKFTADTKELITSINSTKEAILSLGESKNLSGLIAGLENIGIIAGTLGVAFFAVKEAFEAVFDAEKLKQTNAQFEMLATNAGVASEALLEQMKHASAGLIDENTLLQITNKGLVELGSNAERLGEVMELARKVTAVFGGDLSDRFQQISQAIATGQTRMLRQIGLTVDANKAHIEYAKSIGVTVGALTDMDKQTALLNAVMEAGDTRFKGANANLTEAHNNWMQFKATMKDVGDALTLIFDKIFGGYIKEALQGLSLMAKDFMHLAGIYGTGTEGMKAQSSALKEEVKSLEKELFKLNMTTNEYNKASVQASSNEINKKLTEKIALIKQLDAKLAEDRKNQEETADKERSAIEAEQARKRAELGRETQIKVDKELNTLRKQGLQTSFENSKEQWMTEAQYKELIEQNTQEKINQIQAKAQNQIDEYERQRRDGKLTTAQFEELQDAIQTDANLESHKLKLELIDQEQKRLEEFYNWQMIHGKTSTQQIEAGWQSAGIQAVQSLQKSANIGAVAFGSLQKNSKAAFIAMGDGSKSAGDAMKGFIFSSLADIAEAQGELHVAAGIASMNPVEFAEGGVLLALSGFLRSQAGGGSSMGGSGGGGGGGGGVSSSSSSSAGDSAAPSAQVTPAQHMQIVVQGNIFDSDATRTRLMELMRQAQDMQDFRLVQIGQA